MRKLRIAYKSFPFMGEKQTVFQILEQEGDFPSKFVGSNGWEIRIEEFPKIYDEHKKIYLRGRFNKYDNMTMHTKFGNEVIMVLKEYIEHHVKNNSVSSPDMFDGVLE